MRLVDRRNLTLGLFLIGVAAVYFGVGLGLNMGTSTRMGPGYFPMLLVSLLAFFGLLIILKAVRRHSEEAPSVVGWRGIAVVSLSVVLFGLSVTSLGFLPAVAIAAAVSSFASSETHPAERLALTAVLVVFSWLIFIVGLNLPIPILGSLIVRG